MNFKRLLVAIAALLVVGMLLVDESAGKRPHSPRPSRGHRSSRNYRSSRNRSSATAKTSADLVRAAAIRAAAVRAAQVEVRRAHTYLTATRARLAREFELSPQMLQAAREKKQARRTYDAERQRVLDQLAQNPKYRAARDARKELYDQVQALRRSDRDSEKQIEALSKEKAAAGAIVTKMQAAANNADSETARALTRVQSTAARVRELKLGFQGSLTRDLEWIAARKNLEQARAKFAQAHAAGNRALAKANRSRYSGRR